MELINNRYKVMARLHRDKYMSSFKVADLWERDKIMQLNLLAQKYVPQKLIDYLRQEFIRFVHLKNEHLIEDYHFNRLTYIDNKKSELAQYYYVNEYIEEREPLSNQINQMDFSKRIAVFMEVCRAINYLHIKGHHYGNICLSNVIYQGKNGKVCLESLAGVRLQDQFNGTECSMIHILDPSHALPNGEKGSKTDLHDLGVLLLKFMQPTHAILFPERELDQLESGLLVEEDRELARIIPIIRELLKKPKDISFTNVDEVVQALNEALQTNYTIIDRITYEELNFHTKLINQETISRAFDKSVKHISTFERSKKLFLINGESGAGKTRLLEELAFNYTLEGMDVYAAFTTHHASADNRHLWIGMFRNLLRDCDVDVYEKYESDVMRLFPELADEQAFLEAKVVIQSGKRQLLERIGKFVGDSIGNRNVVFLIDNIHLASDLTLKIMATLTQVLDEKNAIVAFTFNDKEMNNSYYFKKLISTLTIQANAEYLQMEKLTLAETGEVIQDVLSLSYIPKELSQQIHQLSDGNPSFTVEAIKDLFNRGIIYANKITGHWNINLPETGKVESLSLPTSVEQILLNQIDSLGEGMKVILKKMSIYTAPKPLEFWGHALDLSYVETNEMLLDLMTRGIVTTRTDETVTVYGFKNRILRRFFTEQYSAEERRLQHVRAAELMESGKTDVLLREIIYHFEGAELPEKVLEYCLKDAEDMRQLNDWGAMFSQLKKALSCVEDSGGQVLIMLKIASGYLMRDNKDDALTYYKRAEKLVAAGQVNEQKIDIYLRVAKLEIYNSEFDVALDYLAEVKQMLAEYAYVEGDFEMRRVHALKCTYDGQMEKAIDICMQIMQDTGEDYALTHARAAHVLAYAYTHSTNEIEKAIVLYEHAILTFEAQGLIRELIYSTNHLALIYLERLHALDIAYEKFTALNALSQLHNFTSGHVMSLINLGSIYGAKGEIKHAFDTFVEALQKAKQMSSLRNKVPFIYTNIIRMGLNLHLYESSHYYLQLFEEDYQENKYPEYEKVQIHLAKSLYYYSLGIYDEANESDVQVMESVLEEANPLRSYSYVRTLMYEVRTGTPLEYEPAIQALYRTLSAFHQPAYCAAVLLDFTLVLHEVGDVANVKRLNTTIKQYMDEIDAPIDRVLARYHYLRGVVDVGDGWEEQLLLSLHYAEGEIEFSARVMLQIAERYAKVTRLYLAANYYLECGFIFKKLLEQVPDVHKLDYVHAHQCAVVFRRLGALREIIINKARLDLLDAGAIHHVHSVEEVKRMMRTFDIRVFTENEHFITIMQKEYRRFMALEYEDMESIVANLSSNADGNVKILLSHLVATTITNRAYVVMEVADDYEVLTSIYDQEIKLNKPVLNRVKSTLEPVVLFTEADVSDAVVNKVKRSLYMPIFGNDYYLKLRADPQGVFNEDFRPHVIGFLCVESDRIVNNLTINVVQQEISLLNLTALLVEKRQLQIAASIDKVTGALTRKYLEDAIIEEFNKKIYTGIDFCIIMIDLDNFKRINDRFGHQVGDNVLRNLSRCVMEYIGKEGVLGRYGGEEFVVILPQKTLSQAMILAEELRKLVHGTPLVEGDAVITISLGVVSTRQAHTIEDLIGKADQALYAAKEAGRNVVLAWDSGYTNNTRQKKRLTEFVTGNEVQDSRHVLALVELLELVHSKLSFEEKVAEFIGRLLETVEAQSGYLFLVEDGLVMESWKRCIQQDSITRPMKYNQDLLDAAILKQEGNYVVQWGDLEIKDVSTGLPNWHSNLLVPVMHHGKLIGVIYLIALARMKEFRMKDLNIVSVLGNVAATLLHEKVVMYINSGKKRGYNIR